MLAILIIALSILAIIIFSFSTSGSKDDGKKDSGTEMSAQDLIDVLDIKGHVLYTKSNYCISYIQLQPPMSSLWSRSEKEMKTNTLVAEMTKERNPWILTAVSRPMDITQLINQYKQMRETSDDPLRKQILKQEMQELQNRVGAGEAIERQFYIRIWEKNQPGVEEELFERARKIVSAYESIGVISHVLKRPDIIRFCNLVNNPTYINVEDVITSPGMPMIGDVSKMEDEI